MDSTRHNLYSLGTRAVTRRSLFRGVAIAGIGAASIALVGCGDDDNNGNGDESTLERARREGRIRIGFANEAPYGFADASGEVTGEAPTVAREVFSRLGIDEVDAVVVPFGSLIPGLQAGRFDVIAAGMFINPDRCDAITFSDPDYCVPQAFGVAAGNPMGLNSYEDVAANPDAALGVQTGGVEAGYAEALGVSSDRIVFFDDIVSAGEGLSSGRVDAIAATSLAIRAEIERVGGNVESTEAFDVVIDGQNESGCGGYGFRNGDGDLHEAFNDILVQMKDGDEIKPLVLEFGFDDEVDAAKGRTAAELCEG